MQRRASTLERRSNSSNARINGHVEIEPMNQATSDDDDLAENGKQMLESAGLNAITRSA